MSGLFVQTPMLILCEILSRTERGNLLAFPCVITAYCKSYGVANIIGSSRPKGPLNNTAARVILGRDPQPDQPTLLGWSPPLGQPSQDIPTDPTVLSAYFEQMFAQFQSCAEPHYQRIECYYTRIEDQLRQQEEQDR